MSTTVGRNDPCPCGSGRKFKHCCLETQASEDSARLRLRGAEGRVIDVLFPFTVETWGKALMLHAWEDFWNYDDVPEDLPATPEFDTMFIPWLVLGFVPDPEAEGAEGPWPTQPIGLERLATSKEDISDLDREYIEVACRSPLSVFVVERVVRDRSVHLKDVLTGARFRALERGATHNLRPADLIFTRVLTIHGVSILFGAAPFIVPPRWHTRIIDWRERLFPRRLMTREDIAEFDIEIRDLYFDIAAELLDPTPPRLCNTDGDPLTLTTLTYDLKTTVDMAIVKLSSLAVVHGEDHSEATRDASGTSTSATLSWIKAGNRKRKDWDNTVLGTLRLESGHLVVDVNSTRRAERMKREITKRLGKAAVLIDTAVVDPTEELAARARQRAAGERVDESLPESPPEFKGIQEEPARRHWEAWLDMRVPALRNKTPRQAARSAGGRERLEALLAEFERDGADESSSARTHLAVIRRTLGLTKARE